jgi:hypothetical protein
MEPNFCSDISYIQAGILKMVIYRSDIYYLNYTGDFTEGIRAPCSIIIGMAKEQCCIGCDSLFITIIKHLYKSKDSSNIYHNHYLHIGTVWREFCASTFTAWSSEREINELYYWTLTEKYVLAVLVLTLLHLCLVRFGLVNSNICATLTVQNKM